MKYPRRHGGVRDVLNPYRIGAGYFLKRFFWDSRPLSWSNKRKIRSLRDTYKDKSCVILGNGKSLKDVDLPKLEKTFVFGLNKINFIFKDSEFRPSAIVAMNELVIDQNKTFYSQTNIPLFINRVALNYGVKPRSNVFFMDSLDHPYFARDPSISVFPGYTVTYVALQIAFYMGFGRVAVVGMDHEYGLGDPNQIVKQEGDGDTHFARDYFSHQQEWEFPDLQASEYYLSVARRCFELEGKTLVNASTYTKLRALPCVTLDSFVED